MNIVADISSPVVGWGLDVSSTPRDVVIGSVSVPTIGPAWTAAYVADGNGFRVSEVPEPTSLTILALGGMVAMRRRA